MLADRSHRHRVLLVALLVVAILAALELLPAGPAPSPPAARAADAGQLRSAIRSAKQDESTLSGAIARLNALERRTATAIALLQTRLDDAQSELDRAQSRLADTEQRLRAARARNVRLRHRLGQVRATLADVLRTRYVEGPPDWTDVVLQAQSFGSLMERFEFLDRVQESDASLLSEVRTAKAAALTQRRTYARLVPGRRAAETAVLERRDSLAGIRAGLDQRRAAFAQAAAAKQAALNATRANRASAQKHLTKVLADQERAAAQAAVSMVGPGGPWAIPWAIVQCESGGRDVGPNSAGASGYYQFIVDTWRRLGGSTPQAYQASKAEQDRLAAKLWDHGRGAHNWDCAAIVGIT